MLIFFISISKMKFFLFLAVGFIMQYLATSSNMFLG